MAEALGMIYDHYNFTESQNAAYSKLIKEVKRHQLMIEKAKQSAKQSPSESMRRAISGVEYHSKMLLAHDKELEDRIEKTVRRLREDAEEARQRKKSYLADAEKKLYDLENIKSRTEVAAEIEIDNLKKQIEKMNLPKIHKDNVASQPLIAAAPSIVTIKNKCPCGRGCPEVPIYYGSKETILKCLQTPEDRNYSIRRKQEELEQRREKREEEEKAEQAKALYMQQKEQQAQADIKRQDEQRRKELENRERHEQLDREVEEELEEERRQKEQEQPPLTPFQGLPPPDAARAIKPTKMVKTPLGTYATKMYATPIEIV